MHVSWGWIKQRPHFFAEGLSQRYELTVITYESIRKKNKLNSTNNANIRLKKIFIIPFSRFGLIKKLSDYLYLIKLKRLIRKSDIIWFTAPSLLINMSDPCFYKKRVIYDSMDDMLAFPSIIKNPELTKQIFERETHLYRKADLVFVSCEHLKNKLIERFGIRELFVINNAIIAQNVIDKNMILSPNIECYFKNSKAIKLTYIGTVSEWIDFDLLINLLEAFEDLEICIFGPCDFTPIQHERLFFFGPIEHRFIFTVMEKSDALIMPFKLCELIESVNPVKLYEYIYSLKPCISISYSETKKFEDFVYLYENKDDLLRIIEELTSKRLRSKRSLAEVQQFCDQNTWEKRIETIFRVLEESF